MLLNQHIQFIDVKGVGEVDLTLSDKNVKAWESLYQILEKDLNNDMLRTLKSRLVNCRLSIHNQPKYSQHAEREFYHVKTFALIGVPPGILSKSLILTPALNARHCEFLIIFYHSMLLRIRNGLLLFQYLSSQVKKGVPFVSERCHRYNQLKTTK